MSSAPQFVMVTREKFTTYWPLPWVDVVAAVEAREPGLSWEAPKWTPTRTNPPTVEQYTNHGIVNRTEFEKDSAAFERQKDCAFFRKGTDWISEGQTMLFQQNW